MTSTLEDKLVSGKIDTRIGSITLEKGLPAGAGDSKKLFDELDFQRACQTYLWALPIVSFAEWQHQHENVFGAKDGQLVIYDNYRDKLGILTANATTPYIMAFANLLRTGPLVIDFPAGPMAGGVGDFWQRSVTDMGETGPDRGQGAKYLLVGPGQKVTQTEGFQVVQMPMNNIMFGVRSLEPDPQKSKALIAKLAIYPFSEREKPSTAQLLSPAGKSWNQGQPRGLAYWERLNSILQVEPVEARDRMMMAMLIPLGIEKGKPFSPDNRQKELLQQGAEVGELMAMNFSFNKRFEGAKYRPDANWVYVLEMKDPNQEDENNTQLDQRTAWFYEAVTASKGMMSRVAGLGQAYLGSYHDQHGNWFDGAKTYKLRVPPNQPAKQFWSLTVYDTRTRCLIDNKQGIGDKSSRMPELEKNADGSVDLYVGPTAISGHEQNWIPSIPGRAWFAYFRLYAPTEAYLDSSWPLPNIELIEDAK
ncbi:DUF1254 domain-containing protein [Glaciimonas soli]|uniref:DUF1214 domain-containing protein n=1 Tax=Glaciimonas soli TaxID=2590999 RepID=A0A843YTG6_9BURK|nr:DUF1254 domain-containing protein [Glaciimonas soli]MQR00994.1 DUF1214 domain-containing protein [Glaciimonas soli]